MQQEWLALMARLGVGEPAAVEVFTELKNKYEANGLAYHNFLHVTQVWQSAQMGQHLVHNWTAVQLAIFFHDVVYVPGANDNEDQSALYARRQLQKLGIRAADLIADTERLILATKLGHTAVPDSDTCVMLDSDLATLGFAAADYQCYAQAIRLEFSFVPETAYREGRKKILNYFLQRPRIYYTDPFYNRFEIQARLNISHELRSL